MLQIPALLEHECRALDARFQGRRWLRRAAAVAVAATVLTLWLEGVIGYVPSGGLLFKALFVPTAIFLLCSGNGLGARLVEHRRNQLLGLVFLTHARPRDLFLSQIGARVIAASYLALALLPCLCISILYGGASKERCIAAALFLVIEVLFVVASEFLGPALTTDPGAAGLIANISGAILALWPWVVDRISLVLSGRGLPAWIYFFSPVSAFLQVLAGFNNAAQFYNFLVTCGIVAAISIVSLLFSAWILAQTWREEEHPILRFRVFRLLLRFSRHSQRQWAKVIRSKIEIDPLLWIATYDLRSVRHAWVTVAITIGLWFAGLAAWGKGWLVPGIFYIAAATLVYGVHLQMLLRAASRFSESRHNQFFDAMLAANFIPENIIDAEEAAIFLQFKPVVWTVRGLTLLFVIAPTFLRVWTPITLCEHILLSAVLIWTSKLRPRAALARTMWIALNTGAGASAVFRRSSFPIANFGFQFYRIIANGAAHLAHFPGGGFLEKILVFIVCPIAVICIYSENSDYRKYQVRTANWFREILQAPLRTAKEIAKWDTQKPLI